MKRLFVGLLVLTFLIMLGWGKSSADQFIIDDGNGFAPDQNFATVDVTFNSGTIHVVVTTFAGFGIFGNGAGNGAFGYNVVDDGVLSYANIVPTGGATGCSASNGGNFDGFGSFEASLDCGAASDNITSLSFDITRPLDPFTTLNDIVELNAGGFTFAAHICARDASGGCSGTGFAASTDEGSPGPGPGPGPGPSQEIPEPSSLILLGSGLIMAVPALRRRFSRK